MAVTLWCALSPGTNGFFLNEITLPVLGYQTNYRDVIIFFSCISGVHYNLENIYQALKEAKSKRYAMWCLLPYLQFILMLIASSYSRFFT